MEFTRVEAGSFIALGAGAVIAFVVPLVIALIWTVIKKEKFTTVLVGAATFLLFALILEKPLQAVVIMMDHPVSRFINDNPILLVIVTGLFAGVFEETGRLVAFKTVLKNRGNRETAISYGIGHGGIEIMAILGVTYVGYIVYALMINAGTFQTVVDQVAAQAPDQVDALYTLADQIAAIGMSDIGMGLLERASAFLFHVGLSILVFYACRDKGKLWLYPVAITLHAAMDFMAAGYSLKIIEISIPALELIFAVFAILTFFTGYFLLYR